MTDQRKNRKAPLEQAFEWFLLARNFSPKTRQVYKDVLRSFLSWLRNSGYEGLLGDLDPQVVRSWNANLEKTGRSINTRRGYLAALKSFSKYLAEDRIILDRRGQPHDLLAEVRVPPLPRSRPQVYADAEIQIILDALDTTQHYGARNAALILLMFDGGLRLREACQIRLGDVDWQTG